MQKLGCKGRAGAVIELLKLGEISIEKWLYSHFFI
jgi:hypothetical protein